MKHALFKSVMAVASFLISSNDVACAQPNAGNIALVEDSLAGTFCPVDAGTFVMGRTPIDVATKADEVPQHEVKIEKPFLIGQHEVTVDQFRLFCAQSGYVTEPEKLDGRSVGYRESTGDFELDRFSFRAPGFEQQGDHPVVCVTRRDANEYCRWLTSKSSDYIYSLPTEAEWEYACRAGSNTTWSGTDRVDDLAEFANLADSELRPNLSRAWQAQCHRWNDHYSFTAPVKSFKSNAWGVFDMHGNVDEWCSDDYDRDAYLKDRPVRDLSASVVRRGGNWLLNAGEARAARRHPDNSRYSSCHTGFRIIRRQASDVATDLKYFPVLQFYDPTTKQFAFTYGEEEADLWRKLGMEDSALLGYAVTQKIPGTKPVFRIQPRPREFLYYFSAPQNIRANDVDTFSLFVWRSSGAGKVAIFGTSASNGSNIFLSRDKKAVEKYRDDQMEKFGRKLREVEQLFYLQASMP